MGKNVAQKLIASHLVAGAMTPGEEISLKIDQTLTQDATGTLVMLAFEAMGIPRAKTDISAQYVDHNLLQTDFKNADDHLFLLSACKKFGVWYSRPETASAIPSTWSASACPASPAGFRQPYTGRRLIACWPSGRAGWKSPWPWPESRCHHHAEDPGRASNR